MKSNTVNCVIYSRVSTEQQSNESAVEDLQLYAQYMKYEVLGVFEDKISGKTKTNDRPAFKEMQNFILSNRVDNIFVWSLSRLGRNLKDVLETVDLFNEKGINVFAKKENLSTLNPDKTLNPTANMILGIMGSVAQYERTNIIDQSKRGLHFHLKNGGSFSLSPYGYTSYEKKIVIEPNEAVIVKRIYDMFLSGTASPSIAKYLNSDNIPTKKGVKWSDVQVRDILHSPMYFGERKYNFGIVKVPAIITKPEFLIAQQIFDNNCYMNKDKAIFPNYLSGLVKCGVCGLGYFQHARQSKKDFVYKCMSTRKTITGQLANHCGNLGVNINLLNSITYQSIINDLLLYLDTCQLDNIIKAYRKDVLEIKKNIKMDIKNLNNQIEKSNKKLNKLRSLVSNEVLSDADYLIEKQTTISEIERYTSKLNQLLIDESNLLSNEKSDTNNYFENLITKLKKDGIEATDPKLLVDLELYRYYTKNLIKGIVIQKCDINDTAQLKSKIAEKHKNRITKIIIKTIFSEYFFYTVTGFYKLSFEFIDNELVQTELIPLVCQ